MGLQTKTKKPSILMAAGEAVPYAKTGGLADVVGALSAALAKQGYEVTVFLPLYAQIDTGRYALKPTGKTLSVLLSDRKEEAELWTDEREGVTYYFIQQDRYFGRPGLYGTNEGDYRDNAERFIFFSRGVLEGAKELGLQPDILHCHDWHTGLIPLYLKTLYADDFKKTASLFTIHNLGYQGAFWHYDWHLLNLPWEYFNYQALEFYGKINFLKGGLIFADALSTVSPKYAREIQTAAYGHRLEGVLSRRKKDLYGILNGIDTAEWNPANDRHIPSAYDSKNLAGKEKSKSYLQEKLGLPIQKERPLFAMISRLTEQKGVDLVAGVFEKLMKQAVQLVVLGSGEKKYETLFQSFSEKYPKQAAVKIAYDTPLAHQIEAGADIFLMPSKYEPCGLNQMMSLRYGTVPIVRATGGLDNTVVHFDPQTLQGNGFKFKAYTATAFFRQIQNALSIYSEKKKWQAVIQNGMAGNYSWDASAEQYLKLYQLIIKKREGR